MSVMDKWKEFETVLDPAAGPIQREEMQMAFFSGMWTLLGLLDPSKSPSNLHEECRRLYRELADQMAIEHTRCAARRAKATSSDFRTFRTRLHCPECT